ncbi:MAG: hypothetical protein H3Z52_06870 [archaeon]|nr:hypothetical protein [archaeon]MCP8320646.1 hypothetical protein [archaeon]
MKLDTPLSWFFTVPIIMLAGMNIDFVLFPTNLISVRVITLFVFVIFMLS